MSASLRRHCVASLKSKSMGLELLFSLFLSWFMDTRGSMDYTAIGKSSVLYLVYVWLNYNVFLKYCCWQRSLQEFWKDVKVNLIICWTVLVPSRTMFSATGKRCFTIESLVAKENPLTPEDPIRPTALSYSAPADSFLNGYQSPAGRALYPNPELVFSETVNHAPLSMHPHPLGSTHLQHPHFFGTQHREPLNFYPWVLRNRFFGHRFQGKLDIKQLFHLN